MRITSEYVFFWTGKDVFSNFYFYQFKYEGRNFHTSEQAIMYAKAVLFKDYEIAKKILNENNPNQCKKLGRQVKNFDENVWVKNREVIYKSVLIAKFSQPELKVKLLQTGDKIMVEASPFDKIWGVGLREDDDKILDSKNWKGLNLLGKVLMEVRNKIK